MVGLALVGAVVAAAIGVLLGLLGGGGSILAVPAFVYVLGFGAEEAIVASLAVVGVTSLAGSVGHWRVGNTDLRAALPFGVVATAGAYLGARLAAFVSGEVQLAVLAGVMLLAAFSMSRERRSGGSEGGARGSGSAAPPLLLAAGGAVGVLTGLVGVGGGFLILPALVLLGGLPIKEAVGTSLGVISMNSAAALAGYLGEVEAPWSLVAVFAASATAGSFAGISLSRRVSGESLRQAFAVLLVAAGLFVLFENLGASL